MFWRKPPINWVKLNVDDSCEGPSGAIGAGSIIWDHVGSWQVGFTQNIGRGSSYLAEIWGAYTGLELAISVRFSNVILESDSLELVNLLNNPGYITLEHLGCNLFNCIITLLSKLSNFQIIHCLGNGCADFLARQATQSNLGVNYKDKPSRGILQLMDFDCSGVSTPRLHSEQDNGLRSLFTTFPFFL